MQGTRVTSSAEAPGNRMLLPCTKGFMKSSKRSTAQDRKRVSSQKHEVEFAAGKVGTRSRSKGRAAVLKAKKGLGRKTSRKAVIARASRLASRA